MKRTLMSLGGIALVVLVVLQFTGFNTTKAQEVSESSLARVRRGELIITVTENGYLKAKNSVNIKPKFKRSGTITWLIEEGEDVVEDDLLVEFDKTDLKNEIDDLVNKLLQYEMELEAARANLAIQERDSTATVEKAELKLELATLALERYVRGDAPNELRKKKLAAEKATSEYERANDRYAQVPELLAEGFFTKSDAEEERIRLREAEINKENARRDLEVYQTYTTHMETTQKRSDLKDAERELENACEKAEINLKEKQARATQQERQVTSTSVRLEGMREELGYMTVRAPQPGIVHYGDPARPWNRDNIKIGNTVRSGNTLITLPDLREMQVLVQVHEADIDLVEEGMTVIVTIETQKGESFLARVTEIASVASSQSWNDQTNKTFKVEITMDPMEGKLRAGVTAKVEIQVEELADVIQIPLHAVIPEAGKHYCYTFGEGRVSRRSVTIGKNNAHFVEIVSGLEEGEHVLLYDPRHAGESSEELKPEAGSGDEAEDAGMHSGLMGMDGST